MQFDLKRFREELEYLVNIDSGSTCVAGVNRVADWFADRLRALGWPVEFIERQPGRYGKSLYTWWGNPAALEVLVICHLDTVFPEGTAAARPFRVEADRWLGPGVADMKAGSLMMLHTIEHLHADGEGAGSIGILFNGEHELSCPTIRPYIEEQSKRSKVVVTTEPARANGACVRQRKGVLRYTATFHGRSAHSGVDPENGACAVTEMARFILKLRKLDDPGGGINTNPGLVRGGTSINAVPDFAELKIDVRVEAIADSERMDRAVRALAGGTTDPRVQLELQGGVTRPPMVPTPRGDALIEAINRIASGYGLALTWGFSGGGSDASFASAFGIPALCGLGPVGGGYHTDREYLETRDLQARLCIFRDTLRAIMRGEI